MPISLSCANCGARFRVSDALAGRKGKCTRCGTVLEVPAQPGGHDALVGLSDEPCATAATATPARAESSPIVLEHAPHRAARVVMCDGVPDRRQFWSDLGLSFAYPFRGSGPVLLGVLTLLYFFIPFLSFGGLLGFLGQVVVVGWICAYFLEVISETCRGEDEMPRYSMEDGPWDDIFRPCLLFLGSYLWVLLPLLMYLAGLWMTGRAYLPVPANSANATVALTMLGLGLFAWPMTILSLAIHGFTLGVLRYDRQFITIARAPLAYLAIWAVLVVAFVGMAYGVGGQDARLMNLLVRGSFPLRVLIWAGGGALQAYMGVVAMRAIGLFYRHYKHRFAWEAE